MKKSYVPRHAPAFILLFLSRGPNYGAGLLADMEAQVPYFLGDSAMIYRTLHDLESQALVSTRWQLPESGPPKKYYQLTDKGWERLLEFEADILQRQANFDFFLTNLKIEKTKQK